MNLALRGIEADFGPEHADTFRRDLRPADYVLLRPRFNDGNWSRIIYGRFSSASTTPRACQPLVRACKFDFKRVSPSEPLQRADI